MIQDPRGAALCLTLIAATPTWTGAQAEASHMQLVGQNDLGGNGDGGEGLALEQRPDGRRILYVAHEGQKTCLSVVDVTVPAAPRLLSQLPSPGPGVTRCNSLGLSGNVLAVANQANRPGAGPAGMWLLDVSDLRRVERAKRLDDLRLAFFDTSGPRSRGVHWLWLVDGAFAHLSTGAPDFEPTHPLDDQFYMVVDVRDPRRPREVGRWWLPGTRQGDACLPGCLPARQPRDDGYRAHDVQVYPQRRDRAFLGYIDGGAITLDLSGLEDVRAGRARTFTPRAISRLDYSPPFPAWTHTVQPLFRRGLAIVSDEAVADDCADAPKLVWIVDLRDETNPVMVGTAPLPRDVAALCKRGRFGAHNLHPNLPSPTSAHLENTFVGSFFDGGVRAYRVVDVPLPGAPPRIEEIGFFIPAAPARNPRHAAQVNHVLVDEKGLLYAVDRATGGLYVLRYTGEAPLD